MECCGQNRTGNFCCECGRPLGGHSLLSLRNYCVTQLAKITATYERNSAKGGYIGRMPDSIHKWKTWVDAIDEVTNKSPTPDPQQEDKEARRTDARSAGTEPLGLDAAGH